MKFLKNMLVFGVAFAMIGTPVAASAANPASKLSVSKSIRSGVAVRKNAQELRGGSTVVAVGAIALVGLVVYLVAGGSSSP